MLDGHSKPPWRLGFEGCLPLVELTTFRVSSCTLPTSSHQHSICGMVPGRSFFLGKDPLPGAMLVGGRVLIVFFNSYRLPIPSHHLLTCSPTHVPDSCFPVSMLSNGRFPKGFVGSFIPVPVCPSRDAEGRIRRCTWPTDHLLTLAVTLRSRAQGQTCVNVLDGKLACCLACHMSFFFYGSGIWGHSLGV